MLAPSALARPFLYFLRLGYILTPHLHKEQGRSDILIEIENPPKKSKRTVLLMDNVAFHHSYKVKEYTKEIQWDILFVPPYSHVFNPIEGVFSIVKRQYQRNLSINLS
jgi:transposase